nr:ribonuclease H-like domain-containing protein [Tanacetum cinerariifolium]
VNAARLSAVSAARINAVKPSAVTDVHHNHTKKGNPQQALKDKGVIDSGCSRHMTGNMSYLSDFEELNGGYVAFGSNPKGGKITGKVDMDLELNVISDLGFHYAWSNVVLDLSQVLLH